MSQRIEELVEKNLVDMDIDLHWNEGRPPERAIARICDQFFLAKNSRNIEGATYINHPVYL